MNLEAATKKLKRHGYQVIVTTEAYYYKRYIATKNENSISFTIENDSPNIKDVFIRTAKQGNRRVSSIASALREAGDVARKIPANETLDQLRRRLLLRCGAGLALTDDEILSLNLYTRSQVFQAMNTVFPMMDAYVRRETYKGRQKRDRLRSRTNDLWDRIKDAYVKARPDQAPLRRLQVQATVDPIQGQKISRGYVTDIVTGEMPIFAWDSREAINTVKMMLGEFATAQDFGIVAVGPREEALQAFESEVRHSATNTVKEEIRRVERDIERAMEQLANYKTNLEFAMKKLEVAGFIDGVGNMVSMVAQAG